MKCWICENNEADSGEHLILHSVLRSGFKGVSQKSPVYFHNKKGPNKKVGSFTKDRFKFPKVICTDCNNSKTQNHDKAFLKFYNYMQDNKLRILRNRRVDISKIYKDSSLSENDLYLYFLKIYGCVLVSEQKRLKSSTKWLQLRESILQSRPYFKYVFVSMHTDYTLTKRESVSFMSFINENWQGWYIDLFWFTLVLTYPCEPSGSRWGTAWNPGIPNTTLLKIGVVRN